YGGAGVYDARLAHHRGAADDGSRLDLDAGAEENGAGDLGIAIYVHVVFDPYARARLQLFAHAGQVDLAAQVVGAGGHVVGDGADVAPVAFGHVAEHGVAFLKEDGEEVVAEIEHLVGLVVAKDGGVEDVDAGVDGIGEDLAPARLFLELLDAAVVVYDDDAVFEGVGHALEDQGGHGLLLLVVLHDGAQVEIGEGVAGDDEEGV